MEFRGGLWCRLGSIIILLSTRGRGVRYFKKHDRRLAVQPGGVYPLATPVYSCYPPLLLYTPYWQIEKSIYSLSLFSRVYIYTHIHTHTRHRLTYQRIIKLSTYLHLRSRVRQTIDIHSTRRHFCHTPPGSLPPPHRKHNPTCFIAPLMGHPSVHPPARLTPSTLAFVTRLRGHNHLYHSLGGPPTPPTTRNNVTYGRSSDINNDEDGNFIFCLYAYGSLYIPFTLFYKKIK